MAATSSAPPRQPSIWWGMNLRIEDCADFDSSCEKLEFFRKMYLPNAIPAKHKPHATVLYHGKVGAKELFDAKLEEKHNSAFVGQFRALERHSNGPRHHLTAAFVCTPLQELHMAMRADTQRISGVPSTQAPHVGPNGEHLHKYDVNPHIALAEYATREEMDADYDELVEAHGDAWLLNCGGDLHGERRKLWLGPLEVHYG